MFNRLYVHIPFCMEKCRYCSFVSRPPQYDELREYPDLLTRELRLCAVATEPLLSIYFGGGTPSLLQPQQVALLLECISAQHGIATEAEITLEANPGSVDHRSLKAFRDSGINRISLGMQSFDNGCLKKLGRIHSAEQARQAFYDARSAGFNTISIDLIHSLPGQSLDQWCFELQQAIALQPEHLSIYGLTIEEGTPFALQYPNNSPELADEDLGADMFELADELLTGAGFEHYEIANYARPGCRSQHNCGYWQRDGYRGVGVAAHSFLREGLGVRFSNPDSLEEYRHNLINGVPERMGEYHLTREDAMAECLFLGLRMADGVSRDAFYREFGQHLTSVYGTQLEDLERLGLLVQNEQSYKLTHRGMLLSNQVFTRFLA